MELEKSIGSRRLIINMIFVGVEVSGVTFLATRKRNISVNHGKKFHEVPKDDEITFNEEDADDLTLPHNDAPVISLNVLYVKLSCVD